jgi:uncharacterized protein
MEHFMGFSLLPKQGDFFESFNNLANTAVLAADYFKTLASNGSFNVTTAAAMHDIEHKGDEITHLIFKKLNTTFITPFDREDIHNLANKLDSVIDMINAITNRMKVYKMSETSSELKQFAELIHKSATATALAVASLENTKKMHAALEYCIEVNRLENEGDIVRDTTLSTLFDSGKDPIYILKWKEIYELSETVLDICEDVANVIESIVVKQA